MTSPCQRNKSPCLKILPLLTDHTEFHSLCPVESAEWAKSLELSQVLEKHGEMQEFELTQRAGYPPTSSGRPVILQLHGSFEAFGVVFDYLSRRDPFTRFQVGHFSSIIRQQLLKGHHLVAMDGKIPVGYVGWLLTTKEIGDIWRGDLGKLTPVPEEVSDAAALTVVASRDRHILLRLIRGARTLNPGKKVYFKREYDSEGKSTRKSSVANVLLRPSVPEST